MTAHSMNLQQIEKPQKLQPEFFRFALLAVLLLPFLDLVGRSAHATSDVTDRDWIEGCWRNSTGTTHEVWNRGFEALIFRKVSDSAATES